MIDKPPGQLSAKEIFDMSEEDFALLLLLLGPIGEETPGVTVYMPQSDWDRLGSIITNTSALVTFGNRVLHARRKR